MKCYPDRIEARCYNPMLHMGRNQDRISSLEGEHAVFKLQRRMSKDERDPLGIVLIVPETRWADVAARSDVLELEPPSGGQSGDDLGAPGPLANRQWMNYGYHLSLSSLQHITQV